MRGMLLAAVSAAALAFAGGPAFGVTWQEANKQSVAMMEAGKLGEADELARRAAELYADSPTYKPTLHAQLFLNRLDILDQMKRYPDMLVATKAAIRALEAKNGADAAPTIQFVQELARLQWRLGEFADAQLTQERLIYLHGKHSGEQSLDYVMAILDAANSVKNTKGTVDSRRYLDRASNVVAPLTPDHPARLFVDLQHAKLMVEAARYGDAEPELKRLQSLLDPRKDPASRTMLRQVLGLQGFIHDRRGDDEALETVIQATRDLPQPPGPMRPLVGREPDVPRSNSSQLRGHAVIRFTVSEDGRVTSAEIAESSGNPQFASAAKAAVEKWRYQPRSASSGRAAAVTLAERFSYSIENETPETGTRLKR